MDRKCRPLSAESDDANDDCALIAANDDDALAVTDLNVDNSIVMG